MRDARMVKCTFIITLHFSLSFAGIISEKQITPAPVQLLIEIS
jgi:hypothetical protein